MLAEPRAQARAQADDGDQAVVDMPSEEPKVADDFVTGRTRTTALVFAAAVRLPFNRRHDQRRSSL
jgi:hypothetical protein